MCYCLAMCLNVCLSTGMERNLMKLNTVKNIEVREKRIIDISTKKVNLQKREIEIKIDTTVFKSTQMLNKYTHAFDPNTWVKNQKLICSL